MKYLIDGHNLIPKIPGLSLKALDKEERLIALLQVYSRVTRHPVEVFFDGAPPTQAGDRSIGNILAHFVRVGYIADNAIRDQLAKLGPRAREAVVVSSDHQVQTEARNHRAQVLSSEKFAVYLMDAQAKLASAPNSPEDTMSDKEVQDWLDLFRSAKR